MTPGSRIGGITVTVYLTLPPSFAEDGSELDWTSCAQAHIEKVQSQAYLIRHT